MALRGVTVGGTDYAFDYRFLENRPTIGTVTIGTTWVGSNPCTQTVTIQGVTEDTKVDLQPDATALAQMLSDGVTALWVENDNGTLVAKAMGARTTAQITVQCLLTEV